MIRRVISCRLIALLVLLGLFYGYDWMPLRVAQRDLIGCSLRVTGYAPQAFVHEGSPAVRVGEYSFFYTAECTYLHPLLIVVPLLWVFGASRRSNLLRITIAALAILGGNLVRTWGAVYFHIRGTDWFYTHDLPNYLLWWPTAVVVLLLAVRRDSCYLARPACNAAAE
jgi:exosortase/archaeosortase family protein